MKSVKWRSDQNEHFYMDFKIDSPVFVKHITVRSCTNKSNKQVKDQLMDGLKC